MAHLAKDVTDLMDATKKRAKQAHARDVHQAPYPPVVKYFFMGAALVLLVAILLMGANALKEAPPARVVISHDNLDRVQYEALNDVMTQQQIDGFFTTDLQALRDISLSLPWIDEVSVSRDWQRGIVIKALPKQAIANFGTERLIDASGEVFVPAAADQAGRPDFAMLQGDIEQSAVIMQQMQQVNEWFSPLDLQVEDIILTPRMTWLIRFDSGLRVIVDNENTAQKLLTASQLLTNQLNSRIDNIEALDLRYKNGFTIAWSEAALMEQ